MSITNQGYSPPLRSRSQDTAIDGVRSAPWRRGRSRTIKPRPSSLPAAMGPPNHAPGVPVMGAADPALYLEVMGGPDTGPHVDLMGGRDVGPRVDLMGESDLTFVDSLFMPL